ncbi:MAG: RagB/SusD family nutrient uptake outer membrane protein, partial [Mucilaginibacter sp.]
MKLQYKRPLYFILCGMLGITACKKDFLTVQPTDRISTSAILTDTAVFEAYVTDRYIGVKLQDKEGDGSNPGF